MEPILENPQFTTLLRLWKFITTYNDYLQLPDEVSHISLYELDEHVRNIKFKSNFLSQLIEALVKKTTGLSKSKHQTALFLARNNKFNIFQDLLKTSAYELGHSQVNFTLAWRNHPEIDPTKPFEALNIEDKYRYLSQMVSLITASAHFKSEYMQKLKKENTEAQQQPGRSKVEIYQQYGVKLAPGYTLGIDSQGKCYTYVSKIGDSVLCFDVKKNQWTRIIGQQNVRKEIVQNLMKKEASITNEQLDILQGINDIWSKPGWKLESSAFDKNKKYFNIQQSFYTENKLQKIKLKFHQLDEAYSKFISDCFNFRWASKKRRLEFHKQIDEAKDMKDLVICFGDFFNSTKQNIQRKIKSVEAYDCSLDTIDEEMDEFKQTFLQTNYLYSKGVIAEFESSTDFTQTLHNHVKSFLTQSENFETYFYEYLMIFTESMLGVIKEMYPGQYEKRQKQVKRLLEANKKKEVENEVKQKARLQKQKKSTKGRLINNSRYSNNSSPSEESQSQTTAERKNQLPGLNGRRLRQKVRLNYKAKPQYSNSRSKSKSKSKSNAIKLKKQPSRKSKSKTSKMKLDFDSDEDVQISLSESDTQDKGLSLDSYKYVGDNQTIKNGRNLRSKGSE